MAQKGALRLELPVVASALLFASIYLAWQATHGGVETHHLLARRDLPGFSNWWGLAIVPLIAWLAAWSVQRRSTADSRELGKAAAGFAGAILAGIALCVAYLVDHTGNAPFYVLLALIASGFIFPIYRPEYYLGLVIGESLSFGLVLPAIVSLVPMGISAAFHLLVKPALIWTMRRVRLSR